VPPWILWLLVIGAALASPASASESAELEAIVVAPPGPEQEEALRQFLQARGAVPTDREHTSDLGTAHRWLRSYERKGPFVGGDLQLSLLLPVYTHARLLPGGRFVLGFPLPGRRPPRVRDDTFHMYVGGGGGTKSWDDPDSFSVQVSGWLEAGIGQLVGGRAFRTHRVGIVFEQGVLVDLGTVTRPRGSYEGFDPPLDPLVIRQAVAFGDLKVMLAFHLRWGLFLGFGCRAFVPLSGLGVPMAAESSYPLPVLNVLLPPPSLVLQVGMREFQR
jgi:hypothetical protein